MPAEAQAPQKRRRLPFNPPRPRASPSEGPSSAPKPNTTKNDASTKKRKSDTTTTTSSEPKQKRKSTTTKPAIKTSRKPSPPPASPTPSASESNPGSDHDPESNRQRSPSEEPDYILAEITHGNQSSDVTTSDPAIPSKLLTRILHQNFQNKKTKVAKDANDVVAKYMDVFVREALARAAYERAEGGGGAGGSIGDGFLEVEDLEKMAPQLVLDF